MELFAVYSEDDLLALEMDLDHVPEGELPVTMELDDVPTAGSPIVALLRLQTEP